MRKTLFILILFQLFSCTEKTKRSESNNLTKEKQTVSSVKTNSEKIHEISQQEKNFKDFIDSIKIFKILPIDTLQVEYNITQKENYKIGKNTIQIFKKDSLNIDWIKLNSDKLIIKHLKTINPRVDGKKSKNVL